MKRKKMRAGAACFTTAVTALNLLGITPVFANNYGVNNPAAYGEPTLTLATSTSTVGAINASNLSAEYPLSTAQKIALLKQKVKYVFVLFQENRSFDHYFGTYPGAIGLQGTYPGAVAADTYSKPANQLSSYNSLIADVGTASPTNYSTITPWLIPRTYKNVNGTTVNIYPEDTFSVSHAHSSYIYDFHADTATLSTTLNDGYALAQENLHFSGNASTASTVVNASGATPTAAVSLQTKQEGEVAMSHIDCDTIPILWQYADRFTLFDNMHQTATGPSSPNAIAIISGQVGDTQWVKHPTDENTSGPNLPVLNDAHPFPGSSNDTAAVKPPYGPDDGTLTNGVFVGSASSTFPLTYASLPLSFMGSEIGAITHADEHPATDLIDVATDIQAIAGKNPYVAWGWYQQGYGPESFDGSNIYENGGALHYTAAPEHASYVVHHNGPQYFGYVGDNTTEQGYMHGLTQFYSDVANQALPAAGGVFYVRGGYYNNDGLTPIDPNPNVQESTPGNDDHPNYSDAQISEALVADSVNAIVNSPYWQQSAIIITYDESDGLYDHQPESFRTYGPDGYEETGGPRIPTIVISPYSATHTVSHVYSEHSSVIKFINELFGLTPLANLPEEASARNQGAADCPTAPAGTPAGVSYCAPGSTPQTNLGPADALPGIGDLTEAFDNSRLQGQDANGNKVSTLPQSYALIATSNITTLPQFGGAGCTNLAIVPTDYTSGYGAGLENDPPPLDFNPRPAQSPGSPYYNTSSNTSTTAVDGTGSPWPN